MGKQHYYTVLVSGTVMIQVLHKCAIFAKELVQLMNMEWEMKEDIKRKAKDNCGGIEATLNFVDYKVRLDATRDGNQECSQCQF